MNPIDFFYRAARIHAQRIALESSRERITYAELLEQVNALAAALQGIDSRPQSHVGISAKNNVEHVIALLATFAAGKVWIPLNPRSTRPEIARIIEATEPSIVIADADCLSIVEGTRARVLLCRPSSGGMGGMDSIRQQINSHRGQRVLPLEVQRDATQAIKFTGGTTGFPKGVVQPYRAWNCHILGHIHYYGLTASDRYLAAAPITHGSSSFLLPFLAVGGSHYFPDEITPVSIVEAFRDHGVTTTFMPPTQFYQVMAVPGASRADFPKARSLLYCAAPMPVEKVRKAREFFGPVLKTCYGQTEAPMILTFMTSEEIVDDRNLASTGRGTWFSDVAIVSPEGKFLPDGEMGEVVARSDLVMTGYYRLPEKTAETIVDGWLHTGDRGYLDERGFLFLKDRLRDVVITGGFNVYPIDVENALQQHPAVYECAVFGVPDEKWGEAVTGAVQLRPGAQASEAELITHVKERLGSAQAPKRIHILPELIRSSYGKLLKSAIKNKIEAMASCGP